MPSEGILEIVEKEQLENFTDKKESSAPKESESKKNDPFKSTDNQEGGEIIDELLNFTETSII